MSEVVCGNKDSKMEQKYVEFVEDWNIIETLGEGAYGEVKLLMHREHGHTVAMKIVDLRKKDASSSVKKEVYIHRQLVHPNIIRFIAKREDVLVQYIFLEYASGGELFNRIEPDVGMPYYEAQKYMKQLLSGVHYLHERGIAHRDIKPENLLLDSNLNLKICDFGMATIFRLKGKERKLDKRCGTLPYVAPEVLYAPYCAQPADIWSCGIVLVTMLAGELPWDEPTGNCKDYVEWVNDDYLASTPWTKLDNFILSLVKKILSPVALSRPTIQQILDHPWMRRVFSSEESLDDVDGSLEKMNRRQASLIEGHLRNRELPMAVLSQPAPQKPAAPLEHIAKLLKSRENVCFSQPTQNEDLLVSSQMQFTQSTVTQDTFQHFVKRMTRFFVRTGCEKTIEVLCSILDKLHYNWNTDPSGIVTISSVDGRKMPLIFKANLLDMDGKLLLDFRLSKGCGLEFKRRFVKIKNCLSDIILHNSV